ncbi:hypothetical protein [Thermoanaerobacterium sp. DL9XJH110]|uniref:hypothetical protein n=1 Tax=Thermoanaerobacterium sp. DL9XJH110 TaxID=3386643 RepID=UPI003BB4F43D
MESKPYELVWEGILTAEDYLKKLVEALKKIVDLIYEDKEGEAISLYINAIEGMDWFSHIIVGLNTWGIDEAGSFSGMFGEEVNEYKNILTNLLQAWENRDMVLIRDITEYELIPVLEKWECTVDEVIKARANR